MRRISVARSLLKFFFDLFRTLSSSSTSCKASIYPGVTKFGTRFDVFNDSTVIDISRSNMNASSPYFLDVIKARYPKLSERDVYSDRITPEQFASLIGRAVVGNMRAFILACNRFDNKSRIGVPDINACLLEMATDYYWPLMEEVAPKLGVYEPLIEPASEIFIGLVDHVCLPLRHTNKIAQDRVTVHRNLVSTHAKIFEILEYLGFLAKIEASRGMKSGGRGPVYAINLCSLLEKIPSKRLTIEMIGEWIYNKPELAEIHSSGSTFGNIAIPDLKTDSKLGILAQSVNRLAKSKVYPYGLTVDKISRLSNSGINTVFDLASTPDEKLNQIYGVGDATIKRIRDVTFQAIWM